MSSKFLSITILMLAIAVAAFAQPMPVEVFSGTTDSMKAVKGPDGKILRNNAPVFVVRSKTLKPETPKPGTGIADSEFVIQKDVVNPTRDAPGQIYLVMTAANNDGYLTPAQAIKGEKIFFRVFDTTDTTFVSGTPYADSPMYEVPNTFGTIANLQFGEWKRIP